MKKSYIGNSFALILVLIMLFYRVFLSSLVAQLPFQDIAMAVFVPLIIYLAPIAAYFFIFKVSVRDTLSIKKLKPLNIVLIVLISLIIQPLLMLISTLSTIIFPNNVSGVLETYSNYPLWTVILSVAIIPALCEELFFRGLVFSNYRNISFFKAAVTCGFIFGMAHMDGQQFFYAFFMGIIFCYFVYKTGSIFASIISHFTINCSQSTLAYFLYKTEQISTANSTQVTADNFFAAAQITLLVLPMLILVFYIFHKYNRRPLLDTEEAIDFKPSSQEDRAINAPLIINFVIFVYFLFVW